MQTQNEQSAEATRSAALNMEKQLQHILLDPVLRPGYLRDFRDRLVSIRERLNQLSHAAEWVVPITGRLGWVKKLFARLFRPYHAQQLRFNRQLVDQISDMYEELVSLLDIRPKVRTALARDLEERLAALRTELFLELRALTGNGTAGAVQEARAYAVLRAQGERKKLLLGAPGEERPGYLVVDEAQAPEVHAVCPFDRLPVEPGTVAELVAEHVIERHTAAEVAQRFLPHWADRLGVGGRLVLVTTDVEAAVEGLTEKTLNYQEFVGCLFGAQVRPADSFRSAYSREQLKDLVRATGLSQVTITERRHNPGRGCYEFVLEARKPSEL